MCKIAEITYVASKRMATLICNAFYHGFRILRISFYELESGSRESVLSTLQNIQHGHWRLFKIQKYDEVLYFG